MQRLSHLHWRAVDNIGQFAPRSLNTAKAVQPLDLMPFAPERLAA
jgi:hypothetical protein